MESRRTAMPGVHRGERAVPDQTASLFGTRQPLFSLSAGDRHVPGDRDIGAAAVEDEVVAARLSRNGLGYRALEPFVSLARPQRRPQIGTVLLPEAHIELARAGHANAVAGFAEIMGQGRDEADPPAGLEAIHIARRPSGPMVGIAQGPAVA